VRSRFASRLDVRRCRLRLEPVFWSISRPGYGWRMEATAAFPQSSSVRRALASLTPLERFLWGWAVARAFRNSSGTWCKRIPQNGIRGLAHQLAAGMWAILYVFGIVGGITIQYHSLGPVVIGLGWGGVAIAAFSLVFMFVRINTSWRAKKAWHRRGEASPRTGSNR
jgi:hypothetical protein